MFWRRGARSGWVVIFLFAVSQILGPSKQPPGERVERVRAYTRAVEFDYWRWTWEAIGNKFGQIALGVSDYLHPESYGEIVLDYLALTQEIETAEALLSDIYADPGVEDVEAASAVMRERLDNLYRQRTLLGPLAESVLQGQISATLTELGFTLGGQAAPPVLYRSTPLPWALIVSPREVIRQDANISLETELTLDEHVSLEEVVAEELDLSTLVTPVGGVGTYPTMVAQSTNLNWLVETIAHEWIHNYLTLRPLGLRYDDTPELRTMNETAANIAGKEIGERLLARFYPQFLPPVQPEAAQPLDTTAEPVAPPIFDFRAEMRETRERVDALLAEGEVAQAEAYMEARRLVFWEQGYRFRRLNQAYFAFHGAYADVPGGAAGDDPVGEAVRQLRLQSDSLVGFINRLSWMTSFEQLSAYLEAHE